MAVSFLANRKQLQNLIAVAVNSSIPMNSREFDFENTNYKPSLFDEFIKPYRVAGDHEQVLIDVYRGRLVNLHIEETEAFETTKRWNIYHDTVDKRTSTFGMLYPTYEDLVRAANLEPVVFELQKLPEFYWSDIIFVVSGYENTRLFKLHNLSQGSNIIAKQLQQLEFSSEPIKYHEMFELQYGQITLKVDTARNLVYTKQFKPQEIIDAQRFAEVEDYTSLLIEEIEDENETTI